MPNIDRIKKYKKIHMIGIGGVSMSGIAEILNHWGFIVTGSDTSQSEYTDSLNAHNIPVTIGHDVEKVKKSDLVVYTAAISPDDPELVAARNFYIPTIERAFRAWISPLGPHIRAQRRNIYTLTIKMNKRK